MNLQPVKTAIIGCGNISTVYLKNCTKWPILDVVACSDLDLSRAQSQAEKFNVPRATSVTEVLADPEIELIVNLTIPAAHYEVALAALRAGKSVYNEKPLAVTREEAQSLLEEAQQRQLYVGGAPDTFLGGGLQTGRQIIDEGIIGTPIAAAAMMLIQGPEAWHPDPAFLYKIGAGPLFDIGPYYLTALISMLGPIRRVTGSARITYPERTIGSEPKRGQKIHVETPTHIASVLDFAAGPVATLVTSFDVSVSSGAALDLYGAGGGLLEIQGTKGTVTLPDPNSFGGTVRLRLLGEKEWREIALTHNHTDNSRGLGVAEMAYAMRTDRAHRANGQLAAHVLDTMHAVLEASAQGQHVVLSSSCERPAPLAAGVADFSVDAFAN